MTEDAQTPAGYSEEERLRDSRAGGFRIPAGIFFVVASIVLLILRIAFYDVSPLGALSSVLMVASGVSMMWEPIKQRRRARNHG